MSNSKSRRACPADGPLGVAPLATLRAESAEVASSIGLVVLDKHQPGASRFAEILLPPWQSVPFKWFWFPFRGCFLGGASHARSVY